MDAFPILLFWALATIGFFGRRSLLIYLFFATMPFGSFAVIPTQITAGLTLTPAPIIACLLVARTFLTGRSLRFALSAVCAPKGLMMLFLFWVVAVAVTMLMPRVFADMVEVTPMKMLLFMHKEYLRPTNQNFSQIAYLTISVCTVIAFGCLMLDSEKQQVALKGLCLGGAMMVFTGFLDLLAQYVNLAPFLDPFRTANYVLLTGVTVEGGMHRVVGLMPEASSYGGTCVQFLTLIYFLRHAITDDTLREKIVPAVGFLLLLFIWLSTSSSAYVALVVLGVFVLLEWLWRAKSSHRGTKKGRELELEFWLVFAVAAALFATYLIHPVIFDPFVNLFDNMVLQKTKSLSYEERQFWNKTSWDALQSTYGLGVGMGGTRASNSVIAIFSNTGYLGGLLYFGFAVQSLLRRANPADAVNSAFVMALRWSFFPLAVAGFLAGTSADFGLVNAFLFGTLFAASLISWRYKPPGDLIVSPKA